MKKTKKCSNLTNFHDFTSDLNCKIKSDLTSGFSISRDEILFLDIETTGFSPKRSRLYLTGAAYVTGSELVTEQFLAGSPQEELQLIEYTADLISRFRTVVTFHGSRFDLPFLAGCCERLGVNGKIPENAVWNSSEYYAVDNNKYYVDLYKLACSIRHILGLENYKQKTIENFLGIKRKDCCQGGELISVYRQYLKQPDERLLDLLFLHNYEDLLGMVHLTSLFAYTAFLEGGFEILDVQLSPFCRMDGSTGKELSVTCGLSKPLPAQVTGKNSQYYLHASNDKAVFCVPFLEGTLKYFYPDYKDYYYLPKEDMAVHRSVASYVDKSHREKAKASNCYTKKTGIFLPQYEEFISPAFYTEYKAPVSWFLWTDEMKNDWKKLKKYCMYMLDILRKGR